MRSVVLRIHKELFRQSNAVERERESVKPEYHEGPEALERFEKTMTALFRVPETVVAKEPSKLVPKRKKASKR